jgi:CopG family nickel-responsive transcriptional regulator
MLRFTITIDNDLLGTIDAVIERRGYAGRSKAARDMIRGPAAREMVLADETPCAAVPGYVYDHETCGLEQRVTRTAHHHHDLSVAGMHVHFDHENPKDEQGPNTGNQSALAAQAGPLTNNLACSPT